ncbi:MAG: toll/interleukin-1 receptor domain-containing protein [bacterium]
MTQKEKRKQTLRIFLSYALVDRIYAHKLRSLLSRRANLHIFTTEMLSAGEDWESKLKEELSRCDIFVVVLSPNSVNSKWVLHELGAAWAINKPIIPVVTHPEVFSEIPVALSKFQLIETNELEKPEVINQILEHYEEVTTSQFCVAKRCEAHNNN